MAKVELLNVLHDTKASNTKYLIVPSITNGTRGNAICTMNHADDDGFLSVDTSALIPSALAPPVVPTRVRSFPVGPSPTEPGPPAHRSGPSRHRLYPESPVRPVALRRAAQARDSPVSRHLPSGPWDPLPGSRNRPAPCW